MKLFTVIASVLLLGSCSYSQKDSGRWTASNDEKRARRTDPAKEYVLKSGVLRRVFERNSCDVTTRVDEFKIATHDYDAAMIYYVKDRDLYALYKAGDGKNCSKSHKTKLMSDVKKYTVVKTSPFNTSIVNLALSKSGHLAAWRNQGAPSFSVHNIDSYVNNTCYNSKDKSKSFRSYVAFAIDNQGYVYKIKGKKESDSKPTRKRYGSVQDFKKQNNVCTSNGGSPQFCKRASVRRNFTGWKVSNCKCTYFQKGKFHHTAKNARKAKKKCGI